MKEYTSDDAIAFQIKNQSPRVVLTLIERAVCLKHYLKVYSRNA